MKEAFVAVLSMVFGLVVMITSLPSPVFSQVFPPGISPALTSSICTEDDSGTVDIAGATGVIGQEVEIDVRLNNTPRLIESLGFHVIYDATVLEYIDIKPGALVKSFGFFQANLLSPGEVKGGSFSPYGQVISKGASGQLFQMKFKVKGGLENICYPLQLKDLADSLLGFTSTGGCFCIQKKDATPPNIACPGNITLEAEGPDGVAASNAAIQNFLYAAKATDNIDGSVGVTYDVPPVFPVGQTKVNFTARDHAGNYASCSAVVVVKDTVPPVFTTCPADITLEAEGPDGVDASNAAIQDFLNRAQATDTIDGSVNVTYTVPPVFPPGQTTVTFTAWDQSGNAASCSAQVDVQRTKCIEEDDSGMLDIGGTKGMAGQEIKVPVRIQDIPNGVVAFGFKVAYDKDVLQYIDSNRGNLVADFTMFQVSSEVAGRLKVGGFTTGSAIPRGASGDLVLLKFMVIGGQDKNCYSLALSNLTDEVKNFSKSGGCFCIQTCNGDLNGDGNITPMDALLVFQCYLEIGDCSDCSDVNGDGEVTPSDALCVFHKYFDEPSCLD